MIIGCLYNLVLKIIVLLIIDASNAIEIIIRKQFWKIITLHKFCFFFIREKNYKM